MWILDAEVILTACYPVDYRLNKARCESCLRATCPARALPNTPFVVCVKQWDAALYINSIEKTLRLLIG
jgi:epoxyqueuosine reductase QueG